MYKCVICGRQVQEKDRCFENLDWCLKCLDKDNKILAREGRGNDIIHPIFGTVPSYLRPPYYAMFGNNVPLQVKQKILKEK